MVQGGGPSDPADSVRIQPFLSQGDPPMARRLTRRTLLKAGLTAGAALASPTILVRKASAQTENTLKVVQWKHFVPDYDRYFNQFVKEFGEKNKVKVEVDYVATAGLPTS